MHAVSSASSPTTPITCDVSYPRDRFMRLPEVINTCGLSRSTIYDLISRELFPTQISLGGKNVAWLASEIDGWMQSRIAHRAGGTA
ncbi:helix-turn-helix transcriptional regulator [Erwinia rhapontici]|jgi:prophage regulatory protein|uniref:helix-turn-helix transcriptional regulator n=1 Tax=Erwinia rhapontici TaxID=55212 RepID=UPI0013317EAD|nr:AlpA family transcriptional regulator [Erwinia rhapontici]MBP2157200.1 prophage regulatory protein [Erwinia rhapontici]